MGTKGMKFSVRRKDMTGQRFGRRVVLGFDRNDKYGKPYWLCRCDCDGTVDSIEGSTLRSGKADSCGCLTGDVQRTHGMCRTKVYNTWAAMKTRCLSPGNPNWKNYGGRGITVCYRWMVFENFLADMGEQSDGLTLDRINNDGNYEPGNCRWATMLEQNRNRRPVQWTEEQKRINADRLMASRGHSRKMKEH